MRPKRKNIPTQLRINAVADECGITKWKTNGKMKHQANELHELTNRIRKNTSRAIEKFIKINANIIETLAVATDDTSKGRGFTSLHILMRNLGTLTKEIETKENITEKNYISWHLKCLETYLVALQSVNPNLMTKIIKIKNHDGRTPLYILFQQPLLTDTHVKLCSELCPSGFYEFCTYKYLPMHALVRNSCMSLKMIQIYVDLACKQYELIDTNNINDHILFTVDRTKRKRTLLHELVLSKYCTKDILMYYITNSYKSNNIGWNKFMQKRDGHGASAFELALQNDNFMSDKVLKSFLYRKIEAENKKCRQYINISRAALNNLCKNAKCSPQLLRTAFSYKNPNNYKSVKELASTPDELCDTLLHVLCGNINVKKEHFTAYFDLLNKKDLNARDGNGDSPLHIYCANKTTLNECALQCLLDNVKKTTFNLVDKYGENIVHILMQNAKINSKIIKLIGNHSKSKKLLLVKNKKNFERSGFHELCLNPFVKSSFILQYMKYAPEAAKMRDSLNKSPLSLLCSDNKNIDEKMVLLFLQNKETLIDEVTQRDVDGYHSLYCLLRLNIHTSYNNVQAIVTQFIKYVTPHVNSNSGKTMERVGNYFHNLVNTMDSAFLWRCDTALVTVCKRTPRIHLEDFKFHSKKGIEAFSAVQANGRCCLHDLLGNSAGLSNDALNTFSKFAKQSVMGELMNANDNYSENPIFIVVRNNKQCTNQIIETLFTSCKKDKLIQAMESCNLYSETALHVLCKQKFISNEILQTYLRFAADSKIIFAIDDRGCTPLHVLCTNNNADSSCLGTYLQHIRKHNNSSTNNDTNILVLNNKRHMTPLMCLVRREKPPTSKEIAFYLDDGNDEYGLKALNMPCSSSSSSSSNKCINDTDTPLNYLSRRVKEERIARGVLNTCLELWVKNSEEQVATDSYDGNALRHKLKEFNDVNNYNSSSNIEDERKGMIMKSPLEFTLAKSDETSLPARDTVVKIMKRNKYVVYDTPSVLHQEIVPESNSNIDCNIDKDIKNEKKGQNIMLMILTTGPI